MKKAIVTGANGFVGKWLLKELSQRQVEVFAVVRKKESLREQIPGVKLIIGDMEQLQSLKEKIPVTEIDTLFHLAWNGSTGEKRADYALQLQNVNWTCDAVKLAAAMGVRRFVGAGTLAEFDCKSYVGEDGSLPNAVSCYGSAKIAAHYMSKAVACQMGVEHVWAYLSNTYGEGNTTQNFVNFASGMMLSGKRASFTSGEQPYDFVHASDTAQGLWRIGEKGKSLNSYYIGSGRNLQLKEYIKMIRDAIDPAIALYLGEVPFHGKPLPQEVFHTQKLQEDTGYQPQILFENGIRTTIDWLRKQGERA